VFVRDIRMKDTAAAEAGSRSAFQGISGKSVSPAAFNEKNSWPLNTCGKSLSRFVWGAKSRQSGYVRRGPSLPCQQGEVFLVLKLVAEELTDLKTVSWAGA